MFDVVTIGSAVLDIFLKSSQFHLVSSNGSLSLCEAFNEKIDVDDAVISSGGGGTNTAVGLSRLGLKTACISEVGNDFAAKVIEQDLKEEHVDTSFLVREKNEKTAIASLLISNDGARTALVHRGASRMLTVNDIDWEKLHTKWIHLSSIGNIELIQKVFDFCVEHTIELSWNPGNWEIENILTGKLKLNWNAIDVLIVNKEEMSKLSGIDLSQESEWKKEWCFDGPSVCIITDGANGGKYCIDKDCYWFQSIKTEVVQETGAGDAFATGIVYSLLTGKKINDAVEFGKKEAASVIGHMGAKTGLLKLT